MTIHLTERDAAAWTKPKLPKLRRKPPELVAPGWAVEFTVPCIVVSESNARSHWAERYKRFQRQKDAVALVMRIPAKVAFTWPALITFTRIGGQQMDSDNLAGAFKGCRDQVCAEMGIDDGSPELSFRYDQQPATTGPQGVRIRIEGKP